MRKSIIDLAKYIIFKFSEKNKSITHIKLQKLLFYCSGALLVYGTEETKQFIPNFEAWEYGPVSREVYSKFRRYGANKIRFKNNKALKDINFECRDEAVIDAILEIYGNFGPWALVNQTHTEKIWKDAYEGDGEIYKSEMEKYFKKLYKENSVVLPEALYSGTFLIDSLPVMKVARKDIFELVKLINQNKNNTDFSFFN